MSNAQTKYSLLSKSFHWVSAIAVIFLFALGYWMVELTYYSSWYKTAPHIHKSIGILLFIVTVLRLIYKVKQPSVEPISTHSSTIKLISKLTHIGLYLLMIVIMFSGYLISTADDRGIEVFNLFTVPSMGELFPNQEDTAGLIHEYLAYTIIGLVVLHAAGALKHHFIDKDDTLKRMLNK
ncbi:cytochrome b [Thalassomonas sp. M1454]|uniref:cytochrome b n=1 Tax=Thalassomonas sp. M1454 TaxID=2594477 RepID=UPI00118080D5|nr:cytochrome b [Thalassomonas sp. M1454]TRX56748.1 cytochrome b [Thalassomonas sp. M1454]